jgi:hypothetical protein
VAQLVEQLTDYRKFNGLNPALVGTFKNSEKEIVMEML